MVQLLVARTLHPATVDSAATPSPTPTSSVGGCRGLHRNRYYTDGCRLREICAWGRRSTSADAGSRRSEPRRGRLVSLALDGHVWPSVHGALQTPQTCRRGQCLTVRGPSNSQAGRNGSPNMAIRAARPTQGAGTVQHQCSSTCRRPCRARRSGAGPLRPQPPAETRGPGQGSSPGCWPTCAAVWTPMLRVRASASGGR
jgi:hypothetical protein